MNCDAIAPFYEQVEHLCFGRQLEQARLTFLSETQTARRALICGGGDGRFLAQLLITNPQVTVDFVDLSSTMIGIAKQRLHREAPTSVQRVTFHHGDIRSFTPLAGPYDLLVTNFFLDCFSDGDLRAVIARISRWATRDATWIVSDFLESQKGISKLWTRGITQSLYAAFRLTTGLRVTRLPKYVPALRDAGYQVRQQRILSAGLLHSSVWNPAKIALQGS
jgi:ubiquinone/menaquinone biosynthesis C-methylase UbiE